MSVIVRSYRRPQALMELLERLRVQSYPFFEIVIVEQSEDGALEDALRALGDPRIHVITRPPLGAPAARNEAVRFSRGEILVLIDDDDLPIGDTWIAAHVANYRDPACLGVSGRLAASPVGPGVARFPRLTRLLAMRHTFLKDPCTLAFGSLRKPNVDFILGSNASLRRELVERVGGWDEGVPMGEEQSFAFRFAAARNAGEYLVYDPTVVIWRRVDISGGLDRRTGNDWYQRDLVGRVIYYQGVVGYYFPWRFRLLFPLYLLRILQQVIFWIWDADNGCRGVWQRVRASFSVCFGLPAVLWKQRQQASAIRRVLTVL